MKCTSSNRPEAMNCIRISASASRIDSTPPPADALLGYDSLYLLAQAIKKANSFVPARVAAVLKDSPVDDSLSGTVGFDPQGTAIKHPPRFISD